MEGELLGGKGLGAGGHAHLPLASEVGGLLEPTWPLLPFPCPVDFQGRPACPVPSRGGDLGGGMGWGHKGFTFSTKQ